MMQLLSNETEQSRWVLCWDKMAVGEPGKKNKSKFKFITFFDIKCVIMQTE